MSAYDALETRDPLDILAWQYDIVCNGVELSSGAIRNHKPEIMYKAFEIAGYTRDEVIGQSALALGVRFGNQRRPVGIFRIGNRRHRHGRLAKKLRPRRGGRPLHEAGDDAGLVECHHPADRRTDDTADTDAVAAHFHDLFLAGLVKEGALHGFRVFGT